MKILFLSFYFPYPARNGYQVRTYNLLKRLGKHHEIHLFSLLGDQVASSDIEHMKLFCASVQCNRKPDKNSFWKYLRSLGSNIPYKVVNAYDKSFHGHMQTSINKTKVDMMFIDHTFLTQYKMKSKTIIHVVTLHNMEHRILESYMSKPLGLRKWYAKNQYEKIKKYEMNLGASVDGCIFVSAVEERLAKALHPQMESITIPNGAEVKSKGMPSKSPSEPRLIYVGNYNNHPNVEAVDYFLTDIFPRVQKSVPDVTMDIVGFNPPPRFRDYENGQVRVLRNVDDPRDAISQARVVVIPLKSGAGTKLKVLEAMAMSKAIVMTSVGADGLDVQHGGNAFIADDASSFADCVVTLLRDDHLRERMGKAARETAVTTYDWDIIEMKLNSFLSEIQKKGPRLCAEL